MKEGSENIIKINNEKSMIVFGGSLARACNKAAIKKCIIFLQGELGAGKTTLARGFLREFGYKLPVKSPTYTIVEPYIVGNNKIIYHFDLYRLTSAEELAYIGGRDYFNEDAICLIEWPEQGSGALPHADLICALVMDDSLIDRRTVIIRALSNIGNKIIRALQLHNNAKINN